ncbi:hypothetical protein BD410DRAFT_745314 [Rickenella mellea]|uniref:F-box domain-containing protein n=1 Tax=Rickenella mellea TaxID=50990 RepID=A0A4Y7QAK6_9AGAM|nr:hypothetical protein BD410DRAFT_745314 [Rickenella mellea]
MHRENPKHKVRKITYKDDDDDVKANDESVASASPAVIVKPPAKRRAGRLSLLPTLSTDILFEVFIRLQPLDVLNIMYTSRGFRDLLISPGSTFIWKAVRLNVEGLPDCPPHLSEYEYAKLAFHPFCDRCGKRTPNGPQWEVLARFCGTCLNDVLKPKSRWSYYVGNSYNDILGVIKKKDGRYSSYFYCELQVKRLLKHIKNLPEKSSETWLTDAKRNAPGIREHAELCRDWENAVRGRRQEHLAETKLKRRDDIHQRLSQLGFGPALSRVAVEFANHRLVKPGVGLTERIWNNIKAELVSWIQECETKHLARSALKAYTISHPHIILPRIADLLAASDLSRILDNLGEVPVSDETFEDMAVFVGSWRRNATDQLADLVVIPTERLHGRTAIFAKLELATTVFSCKCRRFLHQYTTLDYAKEVNMHYPWVMAHPCVTNERSDSEDKLWNIKSLCHEGDAGNRLVKPIIEACSLPVETTKTSEMDALDPRLICLNCKKGDAKLGENTVVYTWRSAMGHAIICSHNGTGCSWRRLSDRATLMAKEVESSIRGTKVVGDVAREAEIPQWGCTQCWESRYRSAHTVEGVKSHFAHTHKGSEPTYYRLARCPPGMFEVTLPANQCDA